MTARKSFDDSPVYRIEQPPSDQANGLHSEAVAELSSPKIRDSAAVSGLGEYEVKRGDSLWKIARRSLRAQGQSHADGDTIRDEIFRIVKQNEDRYPELLLGVRNLRAGMTLNLANDGTTREITLSDQRDAGTKRKSNSIVDEAADFKRDMEVFRTGARQKDEAADKDQICVETKDWKKVGPTDGYVVFPCERADIVDGARAIAKHDSVVIVHDKSSALLYPGATAYALSGSVVYAAGGKVHAYPDAKVVELRKSEIEYVGREKKSESNF